MCDLFLLKSGFALHRSASEQTRERFPNLFHFHSICNWNQVIADFLRDLTLSVLSVKHQKVAVHRYRNRFKFAVGPETTQTLLCEISRCTVLCYQCSWNLWVALWMTNYIVLTEVRLNEHNTLRVQEPNHLGEHFVVNQIETAQPVWQFEPILVKTHKWAVSILQRHQLIGRNRLARVNEQPGEVSVECDALDALTDVIWQVGCSRVVRVVAKQGWPLFVFCLSSLQIIWSAFTN